MKARLGLAAIAIAACGGDPEPTHGVYTVAFPSAAAAIATDFVQILVFEVPPPPGREGLCADLVDRRRNDPGSLAPEATPPATNICEMRAGLKPIDIPHGEHALLAVAQRKKDGTGDLEDFMIGCALMTIGEGDAPLPISVSLISVDKPVPETTCASVSDYCAEKCK